MLKYFKNQYIFFIYKIQGEERDGDENGIMILHGVHKMT